MDELEKAVERLKSEDATSEEIKEVIKELVKETSEKGKKYSLEELLKECMDENKHKELIPDTQGEEII